MPADEFLHWQAYYALEPFGQERDNYHAGVVASTVANVHSKRSYKPDDFILRDPHHRRQQNLKKFVSGLQSLAEKKDG